MKEIDNERIIRMIKFLYKAFFAAEQPNDWYNTIIDEINDCYPNVNGVNQLIETSYGISNDDMILYKGELYNQQMIAMKLI